MQLEKEELCRPVILLVDDRPDNLVVLEAALKVLDASCVSLESGPAALDYLLQEPNVALIFMDVQMPGMDGFETAQLIREREASREIPVIFVTAINKDDAYVFKGYETGAVDYLFKPLDMRLLRSKAKVFLDLFNQRMKIVAQQESLRVYEQTMMKQRHAATITQFINGIAHNFNNLLAGVRGYGQLIQMHPDNVVMATKAGTQIMDGVDKLTVLVQNLRNLVLPSEHVRVVEIEKEFADALDIMKTTMSSRIVFKVSAFPSGRLKMNKGDFRAALSGIIANSIEALADADDPTIKVDVQIVENACVISICDNGEGMDKITMSKATVPLFSTKDSVGVGMGLSQVESFAESLGGGIEIDSTIDEGTSVTMILPLFEGGAE